jgi:hypothetical protein
MADAREALRERVADAIAKAWDEEGRVIDAADAAIAVVLEEAAKVAEREGVYPELNIAHGGPDWYRHGQNIAAAIRAMKNS